MKTIIFDTNSLLNLYSYSLDTINDILFALTKMNNEESIKILFVPTVVEEYEKHRYAARSRTGSRNPIVLFKRDLKHYLDSKECNIKNISDVQLSKIFKTDVDKLILNYYADVDKHLTLIEKEFNKLESKIEVNELDDSDDPIFSFVNTYKMPSLSLNKKIELAAKGEIRICNKIKPGLTDKAKDYPFGKYGDVFIWYELMEIGKSSNIIFVENEKKLDWWKDDTYSSLDDDLVNEFKENCPNSTLEAYPFESFFEKYLEDKVGNPATKVEVEKKRDVIEKIISNAIQNKKLICDLSDSDFDFLSNKLYGLSYNGGSIDDFSNFEIYDWPVEQHDNHVWFDSYFGLIKQSCYVRAKFKCDAVIKYDSYSTPDYKRLDSEFLVQVNISSVFYFTDKTDGVITKLKDKYLKAFPPAFSIEGNE